MKELSKNVFVDERGILVFLSGYQYYPANRIRENEKKEYFLGYNEKFVNSKGW